MNESQVRLWQDACGDSVAWHSRHYDWHLLRVWHLLGHQPRPERIVWDLCSMEMRGLWIKQANMQERSADFKMLSWTGYDDGAFGLILMDPCIATGYYIKQLCECDKCTHRWSTRIVLISELDKEE